MWISLIGINPLSTDDWNFSQSYFCGSPVKDWNFSHNWLICWEVYLFNFCDSMLQKMESYFCNFTVHSKWDEIAQKVVGLETNQLFIPKCKGCLIMPFWKLSSDHRFPCKVVRFSKIKLFCHLILTFLKFVKFFAKFDQIHWLIKMSPAFSFARLIFFFLSLLSDIVICFFFSFFSLSFFPF